jgi:hypothetical protein
MLSEMELQAWRKAGLELPEIILEESSPNCADCRWDTVCLGEWYMIHDEVWEQACRREPKPVWEILCIGCLEERLGRALTADDFTDCRINDPTLPNTSSRLRDRMRKK